MDLQKFVRVQHNFIQLLTLQVMDMLEGLDLNLQVHLRRRLLHMAAEFQVAQQVVGLVHQVRCKSSFLLGPSRKGGPF